jgi:hypothetical protein
VVSGKISLTTNDRPLTTRHSPLAMLIPLYCPSCGKELCVRNELLGQQVRCPMCEAVFRALVGMEPPLTPYSLAPEPPPIRWRGGSTLPEALAYLGELHTPLDEVAVPHRGAIILTLGILGLIFCPFPIAGWLLGGLATTKGTDDIDKMNRRGMDPSGRGMTSAGRICGIIAVILSTLNTLAGIFFLVLYLIQL